MLNTSLIKIVHRKKKSTVVRRVMQYSYWPMNANEGVEIQRNIRERFSPTR